MLPLLPLPGTPNLTQLRKEFAPNYSPYCAVCAQSLSRSRILQKHHRTFIRFPPEAIKST
jgi:hypothetical protein